MKILSHRGYWKTVDEKNTVTAFLRSFELGFGTETDVRDMVGELVMSHDMPVDKPITLDQFLALVPNPNLPLAINIKADGLANLLSKHFMKKKLDWFVFDMSVPDMKAHLKVGNPVFARMSEVERMPAWLDQAQGVWLDAFSDEWYEVQLITSLLNRGKRVCIVSPELHGREAAPLWDSLETISVNENLMLCTDYPEVAKMKFYGKVKK